ncbi:hypothetical protein QYM46_13645 [Brevibacterium sp. K11IcPPYGO002]|uniref:hypothetical protein n=1 Tax=Brevibacterium sp. K11IcPPYGO002 TaxID=3058837 RepID=UPI003D81B444
MLRSKNKTTGAASEPTFAEINEKQTPYAGSIDGVPVETAPHVLVSGPTGRGKTTRILSMGGGPVGRSQGHRQLEDRPPEVDREERHRWAWPAVSHGPRR